MSNGDNEPLRVGLVSPADDAEEWIALTVETGGEVVGWCGPGKLESETPQQVEDARCLARLGANVLLMHGDPRTLDAQTRQALEQNLPAWRSAPLGLTFAEALELLRVQNAQGGVLRGASWWEAVEPAYQAAQGDEPLAADAIRHSLLTVDAARREGLRPGELALFAFPALEALTAVRGLPDGVQAVRSTPATGPTGDGDPADEFFVAALLRYPLGGPGVLVVRGGSESPGWRVELVGGDAVRVITPDGVLHRDHARQPWHTEPSPSDWLAADWSNFVRQLRGRQTALAHSALDRQLAVAALLDAIRLAARTGQIERPQVFYEVQKWPEPGV